MNQCNQTVALIHLFLSPWDKPWGSSSLKSNCLFVYTFPRVAYNRILASFRTPAPGTVGSTLSGVLDHKPERMVLHEPFRKEVFVMSDDEITYAQHH